jgi:hypothetical protein
LCPIQLITISLDNANTGKRRYQKGYFSRREDIVKADDLRLWLLNETPGHPLLPGFIYCNNKEAVRRKGVSSTGHQRYKCEACKRSFQLTYAKQAYQPGIKEQVIDMALNGSGIRDTARVLKINMNTVMSTLKKKPAKSAQ